MADNYFDPNKNLEFYFHEVSQHTRTREDLDLPTDNELVEPLNEAYPGWSSRLLDQQDCD